MNRIFRLFIIFILSLFTGCSWFTLGKSGAVTSDVQIEEKVQASAYSLQSVNIVNIERFQQGGRLLIRPFKAGEGVEVNEGLDQITLRIIRGILDVYEGKATYQQDRLDPKRFELIFSADYVQADFVLDGWVTEVYSPSKWRRWLLADRNIHLNVEGKISDQKNGYTVAVFRDVRKAKSKNNNYRELGQEIGKNLGFFIFSKIE